MPNTYTRKSNRALWTEEDLKNAGTAVIEKRLSIRAASKQFNIPEKTLRTRIKTNNFSKGNLGPTSQLRNVAEKKLVQHILDLQAVGFAPTRRDVREIAFGMAEVLGLKNTFNPNEKIAGKVWFQSFMRRNPELSIRKAEGTSLARTEGMNRKEVSDYFELLTKLIRENDLHEKPGNIWNADETGVQLNNVAGQVVAGKGSKDVKMVTTAEKGETITIMACCNSEGHFLPPYCIMKGVYKKQQYEKGAPPGTIIKMRQESAYMNTDLFMDWFTKHFIPRKPAGKNLLIVDGHASHMNNANLLEIARDNNVILLCLPSHTTHYLQPLDRVGFKPLKTYWRDACDKHMRSHGGVKRINREEFGGLLNSAWTRFATAQIGISAFKATGIYPLNPDAIPDHAFLLSCDQISNCSSPASTPTEVISPQISLNPSVSNDVSPSPCHEDTSPQPSCSTMLTPTKVLKRVWPIPSSLKPSTSKRKQSATDITDPVYIHDLKRKQSLRKQNEENKKINQNKRKEAMTAKTAKIEQSRSTARGSKRKCNRNLKFESSSSSEEEELVLSSDGVSDEYDENECVECLEHYNETQSKSDWFKCITCRRWLHDTCSIYSELCSVCGRVERKKAKKLSQQNKM